MRGKDSIKFDGVSLRKSSILAYENEAKFLEAFADEGYAHIYSGPDREKKLKELYAKATAKKEETPAVVDPGAVTNAENNGNKPGAFKPVVAKGK